MYQHDRNIAYKRGRLYIPVSNFGLGSLAGITIDQVLGGVYGETISSSSSGNVKEGAIKVPTFFDPNWSLGFRVHWTAGGTPATMGNVTWVVLQNLIVNGGLCLSAAAGVLNTIIAAADPPPSAANRHKWTSRGILNRGWATREQVHDGAILQFSVSLTAVSGTIDGTNHAKLLGLEIDYVPMHTRFPQSELDAPLS